MKKVLENFNAINEETKKLVYYASYKFTRSKKDISVDGDDMYQDAMLELWKICTQYKNHDVKEIKKIYKKYIWNSVAAKYRKINLQKNKVNMISLDQVNQDQNKGSTESYNGTAKKILKDYLADKTDFYSKYNLDQEKADFVDYLRNSGADESTIKIFSEIAFPSSKFVSFCTEGKKKSKKRKQVVSLDNLSKYFNISIGKVYSHIRSLKSEYKKFKQECA